MSKRQIHITDKISNMVTVDILATISIMAMVDIRSHQNALFPFIKEPK